MDHWLFYLAIAITNCFLMTHMGYIQYIFQESVLRNHPSGNGPSLFMGQPIFIYSYGTELSERLFVLWARPESVINIPLNPAVHGGWLLLSDCPALNSSTPSYPSIHSSLSVLKLPQGERVKRHKGGSSFPAGHSISSDGPYSPFPILIDTDDDGSVPHFSVLVLHPWASGPRWCGWRVNKFRQVDIEQQINAISSSTLRSSRLLDVAHIDNVYPVSVPLGDKVCFCQRIETITEEIKGILHRNQTVLVRDLYRPFYLYWTR